MAQKFYAVRVGKTPGIYRTWDVCKSMVDGFSGAEYKSFAKEEDAVAYLKGTETKDLSDVPYAFVDGSYNVETGVYGYGGFLIAQGEKHILQGNGTDPEMAGMRNVAGEILGSMAAMKKAMDLQLKELVIYYDYMGIEKWATGEWKRNKTGTIAYYDYVQSIKNALRLRFVKVKGHSGIEGNEEADGLAKEAVGGNFLC